MKKTIANLIKIIKQIQKKKKCNHISDKIKDNRKDSDKEEDNISNQNELNLNKESYKIPGLLENGDEKAKKVKKKYR